MTGSTKEANRHTAPLFDILWLDKALTQPAQCTGDNAAYLLLQALLEALFRKQEAKSPIKLEEVVWRVYIVYIMVGTLKKHKADKQPVTLAHQMLWPLSDKKAETAISTKYPLEDLKQAAVKETAQEYIAKLEAAKKAAHAAEGLVAWTGGLSLLNTYTLQSDEAEALEPSARWRPEEERARKYYEWRIKAGFLFTPALVPVPHLHPDLKPLPVELWGKPHKKGDHCEYGQHASAMVERWKATTWRHWYFVGGVWGVRRTSTGLGTHMSSDPTRRSGSMACAMSPRRAIILGRTPTQRSWSPYAGRWWRIRAGMCAASEAAGRRSSYATGRRL